MYRKSNTEERMRKRRRRMRISMHHWGWMMNMTPFWTQEKECLLPIAHQHLHLGLRAPRWRKTEPLTLLKVTCYSFVASFAPFLLQIIDMMELIWSKSNTELCTVCAGEFGRSCGREEVPGMCIAIVSGVLLNRAERLFCDAVCFDPINHKNMVAPRSKTNKREERKKDPFACIESPQSLTVQFQRREYFMKMKHSEMTGIIKAYKSLKWLRLLFFILQVQTCTHASTINCYSHR